MIELPENRRALGERFEPFDTGSITYEVLTELSAVVEVAAEWDALLSRTSLNQAFSSSNWFIAACRNDPALSPHVILARRGAKLAGVLPLALKATLDTAEFPNYLCDYSDIVAFEEDTAVSAGLITHGLSNPYGYKKIILSHIRLDSNCLRAVQDIEGGQVADQLYQRSHDCYYIDLPASYADYLKAKGGHFRKRVKRIQNIARERGLVLGELHPESFDPFELAESFLSLHLGRHGAQSCFEPQRARLFVEEVFPALFRDGRIRILALLEGERMIGIDVYTMGGSSLCAWNGGFLSEAESLSPGKLLIDAGIRLACDLKLVEYDFLRGPEAYKMRWVNASRPIGRVELPVH
jgi:CelD/BcsL family acetyltransferase involved in cellulose biosynthesis